MTYELGFQRSVCQKRVVGRAFQGEHTTGTKARRCERAVGSLGHLEYKMQVGVCTFWGVREEMEQ